MIVEDDYCLVLAETGGYAAFGVGVNGSLEDHRDSVARQVSFKASVRI